MKHRFFFILLMAAAAGFMLWGCTSETQDPVSSVTTKAGGDVKALHKSISAPANVQVAVNGFTITISWDTVTLAKSYHVIVRTGGIPYVDTTLSVEQLVLTNVPAGSYTLTVAGIVPGLVEGAASTPISFTVSSVVAPTVTVLASPIPFCVRNGQWVTVTFSGIVTNSESGANYNLTDEYNYIHYTGTVAAGPYSIKLKLKDRRRENDKDGRQYTFTIIATNSAGTAQASVTVTVPRDRKFRDLDDDDYDRWGNNH
jgi:hypothetical protein